MRDYRCGDCRYTHEVSKDRDDHPLVYLCEDDKGCDGVVDCPTCHKREFHLMGGSGHCLFCEIL